MAFWFLIILASYGPAEIGPFHDQAACMVAQAEVAKAMPSTKAVCVPDRAER